MNRQGDSTLLNLAILLLSLIIVTAACSSTPAPAAVTPLFSPSPAVATSASSTPEPGPTALASLTAEPDKESQPRIEVPAGLRIVYLREGNLWSWTETENNVMLAGTGDMTTVRLSDDSQLLAFMRGREVWTVRMDGTDARLLVTQPAEGGALWFAPNGSLLAVSTADHIDVIDLMNATIATVVTFPDIPAGHYPQAVWAADSSGFKTVIPAGSEKEKAEFLFVFPNGKTASLAKFAMTSLSESSPYISPDGGYVIYVVKLGDGRESLYLMDSSGATKSYGESASIIRADGWLPDSKHFLYTWENQREKFFLIGDIQKAPPSELALEEYEIIRWVTMEHYLVKQDGKLYLADIRGEKLLIAEDVSDFDFGL